MVPTAEEYETALRAAEDAFLKAKTANEVREASKASFAVFGHRPPACMLLGRPAEELLARRNDQK